MVMQIDYRGKNGDAIKFAFLLSDVNKNANRYNKYKVWGWCVSQVIGKVHGKQISKIGVYNKFS